MVALQLRMKKNYEFKQVYSDGRYYVEDYLVMYIMKNNTNSNKVGFSISKKVGKSVQRNRIRRLMKENYRKLSDRMKTGYDIIFTGRVKSAEADFHTIERCMLSAMRRARILKEVK